MDEIDEKGRKLISFYAGGGRVKAKKRIGKRKGGGLPKGLGAMKGAVPMAPMAPMPEAPQDPMAARLDTGVVPRMRGPRARPAMGAALAGALGPVR